MQNKTMQKSRNSKLDGGAQLGSGRSSQYASVPSPAINACSFSSKPSSDSQKVSLVGSTHSVSLATPSSQHQMTDLKSTYNQGIINTGYQITQPQSQFNHFSSISSSSSENFIFTSSAPRISSPSQASEIFCTNSPLVQTSVPFAGQLPTSEKSSDNRKSNSNLSSPVGFMPSSIQSVDLITPQQVKLRQYDQPIFQASRVAVNLNNREEFAECQNKQRQLSDQDFCRQSAGTSSLNTQNEVSTQKEQEYQTNIKTLETKVSVLISELDKQTVLSNSALQDNTMFRKKYQDLKDSAQKSQQSQQASVNCNIKTDNNRKSNNGGQVQELNEVKIMDMQEENKRLKAQLASSILEAQVWRSKYEMLDKHFEEHDEAVKIKMSCCFEKQITTLNSELARFKQSGINNKLKKTNSSSVRTSGANNLGSSNAFKENNASNVTQKTSNLNNQQSVLSEDWHANYNLLKEEREKNEKILKKKIESLEEQNAFLQNESHQTLRSNSALIESQSIQQTQIRNDAKTTNIKELNTYFSKNLTTH